MIPVPDAFRFARKHSYHHMAASERARLRWAEPTITEMVLAQAARAVKVVPFTQHAEVLSGADWIWWWVDGSGAYGMLVQAKRLVIARSWKFGFDYRASSAALSQRQVLLETATQLDLLPAYALYLGTGDYRSWEPCSTAHAGVRCPQCKRRALSLMPALLASPLAIDDATSTYESSVALEDVWRPPAGRPLLLPTISKQLRPELAEFFEREQRGTRAVTRSMMDRVLRARFGQFSAATDGAVKLGDGSHDQLGPVFADAPDDVMHGNVRYFHHVLSPLKNSPPEYVLETVYGDPAAARQIGNLPDSVAGVVVVDLTPTD